MFGYLFVCSLLSVCCVTTAGEYGEETMKRWAVLVAGSKGFENYRHQANVAHAYHLLIEHGIPAERIITFAYDDIAHSPENPFPGKIFNDYSHKDYYAGFVIDYRGGDVTPQRFNRVLMGDSRLKRRGLKVLESGPKDHVFIYFADHGARDLIAFPSGELYANELNDTINYLHQHKRFEKLVIYIEACESGSMFSRSLSSSLNVFVTTAANPDESSYATFCEDKEIGTCLANEYSYNWITNSETHDLTELTLEQQFRDVRNKTVNSHVQEYGNKSLGTLTVSQFQGDRMVALQINEDKRIRDSVESRVAHIHARTKAVLRAKSSDEKSTAENMLMLAVKLGELAEEKMNLIVETVRLKSATIVPQTVSIEESLRCYKRAYQAFKRWCFSIQKVPEVAKYVGKLQDLCADGVRTSVIVTAIEEHCY